jgi:hypothetical protein
MTRALLNPKAAEHLARICGMFGSDHDGERAAAARLADQHIKRLGLSWSEVIRVEAHWRTMARTCLEHLVEFNERERHFIASMTKWRDTPTQKNSIGLRPFSSESDALDDLGGDP